VITLQVVDTRSAVASIGGALAVWLIAGAVLEVAERVRVGRVPAAESLRRLAPCRAALGDDAGARGVGVFVLGAAIETTGKVEAAATLRPGGTFDVGAYTLRLDEVRVADGPNYLAERASVRVTRDGDAVCRATPERRFFPAGGQTTSEVALCGSGLDDLYLVLGERRPGADGEPSWLVRAYWNPLAKLIFFGPAIMALGGLISLSDRRLRLAVPAKAKAKAKVSRAPVPVRPSLEDAPA
jgi:cytochrome c-type biogenesis protein CcmF